ncbi:MAG: hypothetical protein M0R40_00870 [Firmicutes bacterium]|nr:hypothetical protein [Bacillota bacterium]
MRKMQMFCKFITLLIAFTMMASFAVSADGGTGPYFTSTTTYPLDGADGMVKVTSTAFNLESGEQVTYLAYNQKDEKEDGKPYADDEGSNIVFIDQREADNNNTAEFEFVAEIGKIGETVVKFGAERTTGITALNEDEDDLIKAYSVSVVADEEHGEVDNLSYVLHGNDCVFTIAPAAEYKIASITRSDEVAVNMDYIIIAADGKAYYTVEDIEADFILTVEFELDTTSVDEPTVTKAAYFEDFETIGDNDTAKNVTVFSKVQTPTSVAANLVEYGILFSYESGADFDALLGSLDNEEDIANDVAGELTIGGEGVKSGIKKFKALGKGLKGNFAVQLIDNNSNMLVGQSYYITTYVVVNGKYDEAEYGVELKFEFE